MQTTKTTAPLITDEQTLDGATGRSGYTIATYDDGYGPLFVLRDSMSILGVVRAQTWEDAYEIAEDEFFPEANETVEELVKEYGFKREHKREVNPDGSFKEWVTIETPDADVWMDNALFQEAFGFRPNGKNSADKLGHGIYAKDLNGERLDVLTASLAEDLGITLVISAEEVTA